MAVDPGIALSVHPAQVQSPMDALQRSVQIADMIAMTQERAQLAKQRAEAAPIVRAQNEAQLRKLKEDQALDQAFNQSASFNKKTGDIDYDTGKASEFLTSQKMSHLLPRYQQEVDTRRSTHRVEVLNEAKNFLAKTEQEGVIAQHFLDLEEDKREENYLTLRRSLVQFDPSLAQSLPQKYDTSVAEHLQSVVSQRKQVQSVADQLQEAKDRAALKVVEDEKLTPQQRWTKAGNQGEPPTWFVNAVTAKKVGVTAPPASTYTPKKLSTLNGDQLDEAAEDINGNPIPKEQRIASNKFDQRQDSNGRVFYQIAGKDRVTDAQRKTERIEKAYAFAIGKKFDDLSDTERVQADIWYKKQSPQKATEFDKRLALYEKDPTVYSALYGHGLGDKPITSAQKATILGSINREIARQFLQGDEASKYKNERFAELKEAGIDMGNVTAAKPAAAASPSKPEMTRTTNLPKPTASNKTATDAVYQAYRKVYGTHAATLKAMKDNGWQ